MLSYIMWCRDSISRTKADWVLLAYVSISQLNVYFRLSAMVTKYDTTYVDKKPVITEKQVLDTLSRVASFAGTDEVLQPQPSTTTTTISARLSATTVAHGSKHLLASSQR